MPGKKNVVIRPGPEELFLTRAQIARYAGGTRFRMDASMKKIADSIMDKAKELVSPAVVYSVHDVSELEKNMRIRFSLPEAGSDIVKAAFCISTLGARLENTVTEMMEKGSGLEALLLDAAGIGMLESVGNLSFLHICEQAEKEGLFAGCRIGPGYGNVPMDTQRPLFSMTDSSAIGVSLTDSLVMVPGKSLSFFVFFHKNPQQSVDAYKCSMCGLENCPYRLFP